VQPISAQGSFHGDITLADHPALLPDAVGVTGHPPCVLAWPDSGSTGPGQGCHLTVIQATPRAMPNGGAIGVARRERLPVHRVGFQRREVSRGGRVVGGATGDQLRTAHDDHPWRAGAGEQWRILLKGNPSDWRRPLLVTISRPGPDLNPHGPDLRKPVKLGPRWTLSHGISAGQALLAMCPRGDLNPETGEISLNLDLNSKTGEKSPVRGTHANMLADAA
jgi:hypothetical protein